MQDMMGYVLDLLNLGPFQTSMWWHVAKVQRREVRLRGKVLGVEMQPAKGVMAQFYGEDICPQSPREHLMAGTAYVQEQ